MSNSIMNFHAAHGEPCGEDAEIMEVCDFYGDILYELKKKIEGIICLCAEGPEVVGRPELIAAVAKKAEYCNRLITGDRNQHNKNIGLAK